MVPSLGAESDGAESDDTPRRRSLRGKPADLCLAATDKGAGAFAGLTFYIFTATNNTAVGTLANFLDAGTLTNSPSRFYRARLSL